MDKQKLRKQFLEVRENISSSRKKEAAEKAYQDLLEKTKDKNVLSFSSMNTEISLFEFNRYLSSKKKLFLTKIKKNSLDIYKVDNLSYLKKNSIFNIFEPDPAKCKKAQEKIDIILVPGVVFDISNNRIGFGKGYYDRFIKNQNIKTLGIGFLEQLSKNLIPAEKHDISLDEIMLF